MYNVNVAIGNEHNVKIAFYSVVHEISKTTLGINGRKYQL